MVGKLFTNEYHAKVPERSAERIVSALGINNFCLSHDTHL